MGCARPRCLAIEDEALTVQAVGAALGLNVDCDRRRRVRRRLRRCRRRSGTQRTAASLTGRAPVHRPGMTHTLRFADARSEGGCDCEPEAEPDALPKANRVLAPSTEASALAGWRDEARSADGVRRGYGGRSTKTNSGQRRPVAGSDVVVTAETAGWGLNSSILECSGSPLFLRKAPEWLRPSWGMLATMMYLPA